jgi:hypothetical protein
MPHYSYQPTGLSVLLEESVQIAWDYLERSGAIKDGPFCSRVLTESVETMIRQGGRNRLVLSNRAIERYHRAIEAYPLQGAV